MPPKDEKENGFIGNRVKGEQETFEEVWGFFSNERKVFCKPDRMRKAIT